MLYSPATRLAPCAGPQSELAVAVKPLATVVVQTGVPRITELANTSAVRLPAAAAASGQAKSAAATMSTIDLRL